MRKLAGLLRNLEEQGQYLSREEPVEEWAAFPGDYIGVSGFKFLGKEEQKEGGESEFGAKVYALCEIVFEDLNNYCECMIPLGMSPLNGIDPN